MKLKIKITGTKIHEVGYRYFLMSSAMDIGLDGFHSRNRTQGEEQEVIILVDGDDDAVMDFKRLVESKKPERADVSNISFEDYTGKVMPAGEYAQVCTAMQLNKAIPVLLEMRDDLKEMKGDMKEVKGDIKEMKGDLKAVKNNTDQIPHMAKNTDEILEEVRGLREDRPSFAMQLKQLQQDVDAIKAQLKMP